MFKLFLIKLKISEKVQIFVKAEKIHDFSNKKNKMFTLFNVQNLGNVHTVFEKFHAISKNIAHFINIFMLSLNAHTLFFNVFVSK